MAMRSKNKATKWMRDGKRGRRISKRMANVIERREANAKKKSFDALRDEADSAQK